MPGEANRKCLASVKGGTLLPVSAVLLRFSTFRMSLVIFLMVCLASSLSLPTP